MNNWVTLGGREARLIECDTLTWHASLHPLSLSACRNVASYSRFSSASERLYLSEDVHSSPYAAQFNVPFSREAYQFCSVPQVGTKAARSNASYARISSFVSPCRIHSGPHLLSGFWENWPRHRPVGYHASNSAHHPNTRHHAKSNREGT